MEPPKKSGVVITPEDIKGVAFTGSDYVPDSSVMERELPEDMETKGLSEPDDGWGDFVQHQIEMARQMIKGADPAALSQAARDRLVKCLEAVGEQAMVDAGPAQGAMAEAIDAISALVNVVSRPSPPPDLLGAMVQFVEKTVEPPEIGESFRAAVVDLVRAAKGEPPVVEE